MADILDFAPGPPVGSYIKVGFNPNGQVGFGERIWLRVKSIRPNKRIVATFANIPQIIPYTYGDAVEVHYDDVLDRMTELGAAREIAALKARE